MFFGLLLDTAAANRVELFRKQFLYKNHLEEKPIKADRLHVSLHHIGDYERLRSKFIYAARQAGQAVSMRPFATTFRFIASFEGAPAVGGRRKRPLVLLGESDALLEFHKTLGAAMRKCGLPAAESFTPHMTLSYGQTPISLQAIAPIRCSFSEFVLIHSEVGLGHYNMVDRWSSGG
ncbi:MAG TPA: 2'-5' RNA ligase family protein [Lichenihabitans sp.]|nr:2'-5' RNA ligase family protein [Lichenihabitans sp.]